MKMRINVTQVIVGIMALMLLTSMEVGAQTSTAQPQLVPGGVQFTVEQLDQMLAPIALYPDKLLAQVLMAATYPLEIVQADRWLQDPNNAALKGDPLAVALEQQPWDPSVKSLIPFPQILRMMDGNLSWTEQLGDAFLADQSTVMDSIQRLRQKAQASGALQSTPQEVVSTQGPVITIEPPNPDIVYVPVYDPDVIYGVWPYPEFPPYYFPGFFDSVMIGGFGFGWFGVGINVPLWGWGRCDWGRHRIDVDGNRFNAINAHRPPIASDTWQHNSSHRGGVPYRDAGTRTRFQGGSGTSDVGRNFRGYPTVTMPQASPPLSTGRGLAPQVSRPTQIYHAPSPPPAFESFGRGVDTKVQSERGHASRQSMPASIGPSGGGRQQSAPASGGRGHR